jgi:fibro-slime domain-containing protein
MSARKTLLPLSLCLLGVACGDRGSGGPGGSAPAPATSGGSAAGGGGVSPSAGVGGASSGSGGSVAATGGGIALAPLGGSGGEVAAAGGDSGKVVTSLPPGFSPAELGGYQLGAPIAAPGGAGGAGSEALNGNCGNVLVGVVRDFNAANEEGGHPDFEGDIAGMGVTPNLVAPTLGADRKPVYASRCEPLAFDPDPAVCPNDEQTTSAANFDQWYRNVPSVNAPYLLSIYLEPQPGGLFTFESLHYYPVDGAGFNGSGLEYTGDLHNFGFTTELHTQFRYRGGERFTFQGDDDVWVFVNGKLAVDLGGLHSMERQAIDLDQEAEALGLVLGQVYPLDLFHAERHTDGSTFRIDTNLTFVDCGTVVPEPVR